MKTYLPLFVALLLLAGCQPGYHLTAQQNNRLPIDGSVAADSSTNRWLMAYRQALDKSMTESLLQLGSRLDKRAPECALNDALADALLVQAAKRYGKAIDVSHLNYGGIRNGLPAGPLTVGNIFEVMPFDNQLVVLTLTGAQLTQFINYFASHDEALVMGGVRVKLHNKQPTDITLTNGRAILPNDLYTVALSDYVANGGDGADFLKGITARDNVNYLIRDSLIDYFRQQGRINTLYSPQADGRIILE